MIQIKKTDNIFDLIYKIEKESNLNDTIIIEIPFWHSILYNKIALKSVVDKFKNKQIIIHTTDVWSIKIWKDIWIKYSITKDEKFIENNNLLKYNYTFLEYLKYEIKKNTQNISAIIFKNKKKISNYRSWYDKEKPNISIYITILTISLLVFLYVFYFVLNKTYVYISPDIKVQTKSKNFTFIESPTNTTLWDKEEKIIKVEKKAFLEKTFKTTWVKQNDISRAKWRITLINKDESETKLMANTRLLWEKWILYETIDWVNIPAAQKNTKWELIPWTKEIEIRAKQIDEKWGFIWSRWNIKKTWTILTIPWLKGMQNKIYAKTITPLLWWKDDYKRIMWEKDIENAKQTMLMYLKKQAIKEINDELNIKNEKNNITYNILWINDSYIVDKINIQSLGDYKAWDNIEEFKLKWDINVISYIYSLNSLISKIKFEIDSSIIPDKEKILYINEKSVRFSEILTKNDKPFWLKATVEIEVFLSHNFENNLDNYTNRLKKLIAWVDKKEAEKILINEEQISNVNIDIKPFFVNTVSNLENNIKFIIE